MRTAELEQINKQESKGTDHLDGFGWMTCPYTKKRCYNPDNACGWCSQNPKFEDPLKGLQPVGNPCRTVRKYSLYRYYWPLYFWMGQVTERRDG